MVSVNSLLVGILAISLSGCSSKKARMHADERVAQIHQKLLDLPLGSEIVDAVANGVELRVDELTQTPLGIGVCNLTA